MTETPTSEALRQQGTTISAGGQPVLIIPRHDDFSGTCGAPDSGMLFKIFDGNMDVYQLVIDTDGFSRIITNDYDLDELRLLPRDDASLRSRTGRTRALRRYLRHRAAANRDVVADPPVITEAVRMHCVSAVSSLRMAADRLQDAFRQSGMCLDALDASAARIDADRAALEALLRGVLGIDPDGPQDD